jgi:hypothetical protein
MAEYVAARGLMSYGNSLADANGLFGAYAARILKGENADHERSS